MIRILAVTDIMEKREETYTEQELNVEDEIRLKKIESFGPLNPEPDSAKVDSPLPKTLEEALSALEQDTVLTEAIGEDFIQEYIALCKEFQLEKLQNLKDKNHEEIFQAERDLFIYAL